MSTNDRDFFFHKDKIIRYCKKMISDDLYLYRFHNDEMVMSEDRNNLLKVKENKMTFEKYLEIKPRLGHMVIVSSLDREPEWIYDLYKRRDSVEKRFRTIFSILEADETYMRDEDKFRGHLFIAFLRLKILSRLEARIR